MFTTSISESLKLQPDLFKIKPVIEENPPVEELDGEFRKIGQDVLNAAMYSITAVAAEPKTAVASDTLESDFQAAVLSIDDTQRQMLSDKASELMDPSCSARKMLFGRYADLSSQAVLGTGFTRLDERLEPLKLNPKLLGLQSSQLTIPISQIEPSNQGLLLADSARTNSLANLDKTLQASNIRAAQSGVFDMERFSQVWGSVQEGDVFGNVDAPEADFESQSTTDKLGLYIRKIKCEDETNPEWLGNDEIALAGVSVDEDGDTKKIAEKFIGSGFKDGREKNYSSWQYHWFGMRERNYWPKKYGVTFILAEKDNGGLATFLNNLWGKIRDKVKSAIESALTSAGVAVGGILGSPEIGAVIGKVIGKVVAWVVDKLAGWLINLLNDDIFKPYTAWVTVPSFGARWYYPSGTWGNPWSPVRTVRFHGFGGRYRLDYQWRIYA